MEARPPSPPHNRGGEDVRRPNYFFSAFSSAFVSPFSSAFSAFLAAFFTECFAFFTACAVSFVAVVVTVEMAVEENLDPALCPTAQSRGEWRTGNDRRVAPMVGDDQHRQSLADVRCEQAQKRVDLAFEARRHVVNRSEHKRLTRPGHRPRL